MLVYLHINSVRMMLETYNRINSNYHKLNIEHDPVEVNGVATKTQICNPLFFSDLEFGTLIKREGPPFY